MAFYKVNFKENKESVEPPKLHSHSLTFCGDKLILFGGTNGKDVYNDIFVYWINKCFWTKPNIPDQEKPVNRIRHSAEFLMPNNLIIYGGMNNDSILDNLDVFDTVSLKWQKIKAIKNPSAPRFGHASMTVGYNMWIFFGRGGHKLPQNAKDLDDVALFDLENLVWIKQTVKAKPKHLKGSDWSVLLYNNESQFMFIGPNMSEILIYTIDTQSFQVFVSKGIVPLNVKRYCINFFDENNLIIWGGVLDEKCHDQGYILEFEETDFMYGKIYKNGYNMPGLQGMSSCNINEIVVYYGGTNKEPAPGKTLVCFNDMYIFNPEPNFGFSNIEQQGQPPQYRANSCMVYLSDLKQILIYGGATNHIKQDPQDEVQYDNLNDFFLYDIATSKWTEIIPTIDPEIAEEIQEPKIIQSHQGYYVPDLKKVFYYGGGDGRSSQSIVYTLEIGTWIYSVFKAKKAQSPRMGHQTFFWRKKLYFIGGFTTIEGYNHQLVALPVYQSNPIWQLIPTRSSEQDGSLPQGGVGSTATLFENKIYYIGGICNGQIHGEMWILDLNWVKDEDNDVYKEDFCWMNFSFTGDSKPLIYGHVAHLITEQEVFIYGGSQFYNRDCVKGITDQGFVIKFDYVFPDNDEEQCLVDNPNLDPNKDTGCNQIKNIQQLQQNFIKIQFLTKDKQQQQFN